MLELVVKERRIAEVVIRNRYDPGPLGDVLRDQLDRGRKQLFEDLVDFLASFGLRPEHHAKVAVWVDFIIADVLTGFECMLDERFTDVEELANLLARRCGSFVRREMIILAAEQDGQAEDAGQAEDSS